MFSLFLSFSKILSESLSLLSQLKYFFLKNQSRKENVTCFYKILNFFKLSFPPIVKSLSRVRLFVAPWTVAYQALPSMGFSRQECWSGLPFPSPGDLPDPGIEPRSPPLQADTLPSEPYVK